MGRWKTLQKEDLQKCAEQGLTVRKSAEFLGLKKSTLERKIQQDSVLKAIWLARPRSYKTLTYNSETQRLVDWAKKTGIPRPTLNFRIQNGWCPECILTAPVGRQAGCRHRTKPIPTEQRCPECQTVKPLTEFCSHKSRPTGRTTYCRQCHSKKSAIANVRSANRDLPEDVREVVVELYKLNKVIKNAQK